MPTSLIQNTDSLTKEAAMVDKRFQYNPRYWQHIHRTYSEATRDAEYACAITTFKREYEYDSVRMTAIISVAAITALCFYLGVF